MHICIAYTDSPLSPWSSNWAMENILGVEVSQDRNVSYNNNQLSSTVVPSLRNAEQDVCKYMGNAEYKLQWNASSWSQKAINCFKWFHFNSQWKYSVYWFDWICYYLVVFIQAAYGVIDFSSFYCFIFANSPEFMGLSSCNISWSIIKSKIKYILKNALWETI